MVWYSPQTLSVSVSSSSLPICSQFSISTRRGIRISSSYHPSPKCYSRRNNYLRKKLLETLTKPKPSISPPSPQTLQDSDPRKDDIEVPTNPFTQQEEEEQLLKEIVSPSAPIPFGFRFGSPKLFKNIAWCFVGLFFLETAYTVWVLASKEIDGSSGDSSGTVGTVVREKNGVLGFDVDKKKVTEIRVLARKARASEENESTSEASSGDDDNDRNDVRKEVNRRLVNLERSRQSRYGKPLQPMQPMSSDAEDKNFVLTEERPISSLKVPSDPNGVEGLNNNTSTSLRGASDENNGFLDQRGQPEDVTNGNSTEVDEEESHLLSDEVLKRIVLKVTANEQAGRQPHSGLAFDEMNFFLALVRKFGRKGPDYAKQWMERRLKDIDLRNGGTKSNGHEEPLEESMRPSETIKPISRNASNVTEKLIEKSESGNVSFFGSNDNDNSCRIQEECQNNPSSANDSLHFESSASQISEGTNNQNEGSLNGIKSRDLQTVSQLPDDVNQGTSSVCGKDILSSSNGCYNSKPQKRKVKQPKLHKVNDSESSSNGSYNSQPQKRKIKQPKLSKVKDCESDVGNNLWWLDLPYVLAIFMHEGSDPNGPGGLYTLKMESHSGSESCSYTIAFEDRGDASNFCHLLELFFEDLKDFRADVLPLPTKELEVGVKSEGVKVLVVRKGQIKLYAGQPLSDVETSLRSIVE